MQKNLQASKHKLVSSKDTDSTDSPFNIRHVETPTIKIDYREPINLSKEILFNKYFESFNFYFSKHINEILADIAIPHVILYKDFLYYDDEEEYLRRYYKHEEAVSRIPNLSKFYLSVEGDHNKPNLAVHDQNEIILKRNSKLHDLFVNRLKQFESIPKTHRDYEKPLTFRVLPKSEENTGYCEDSSTSYAVKKVKPDKNLLVEDEKVQNDSYQKMLEMQEDMDQISYESQEHDVYNPSPVSSSTSMRVKRKKDKGNNKGNNEASDNKTEVLEVQLLEGSFSMIGKTEGRESKESLFESLGFEENSDICLSNASEISLIEQILGVPLDSEAKGGLVKDVENLQKKKKETKTPQQKVLPKKKNSSEAESQSEKTKEDSKKASSVNKNSLSKSNQTSEDKHQKTVSEPSENKRGIISPELTAKPPIVIVKKFAKTEILNTDISEKLKTEEDSSTNRVHKSKNEKSSVNTEVTSSSSVPLVPLETPKKVDYWAISQAKNNTPAKVPKMNNNNKSDPDVQSTSAGKIRPQKLRRSAQNSTIKKQVPACLQSPEVKAQEKYYDQKHALNYPERMVKTSKEAFLRQCSNPNDKSKDDSKRKSRQLNEEKVDSYFKEERKQVSSRIDKSPQINGVYADHQLYLSTLNSQTKTNVSRSRTEEKTSLLLKSRTEDMIPIQQGFQRSFTDLHQQPSGNQTQRTRIVSSLKVLTSFTDNQQKSARLETASREGGSLGQILSTTAYNFRTQNSMERGKSLRGNLSEERSTGSALSHRVPKTVSLRSLHNPNKGKTMVPNSISSKTNSHEAYDYSSVIARRTMGQTASNPSINGKGYLLATTPISPRKHMNLNINLKKLNQETQASRQHDSGIDNSYGFWTSRSSKGNVNETTSKKSVKESPKLRSERALYAEGRDYGNQPKYGSVTEKTSALNSRRLTKVSMYHEFKVRENEMLRSIKNLKPDYLMAMWPPTSADKVPSDKQETKKRLASSGKRLSGSRIVKGKKKADGKL